MSLSLKVSSPTLVLVTDYQFFQCQSSQESPAINLRPLGARFWWLNAAAWSLLALTNSGAVVADMVRAGQPTASWSQILLFYAVVYTPWFFTTPIVFWWTDHHPPALAAWPKQLGRHLLFLSAWLAIYLPLQAAITSLSRYGNLTSIAKAFRTIPLNNWVLDSVYLVALFGLAMATTVSRSARKRERETAQLAVENAELSARLSEVKLQMLKAQLEPHFLFNALNSISSLIRTSDTEAAVESVSLLSELLRYATRAPSLARVKLGEEVDFAEAYLGFQQLRYGTRLNCVFEVDEELSQAEVPPLILQPLLENAIRHGVETLEAPSDVVLRVSREGSYVVLAVMNSPSSPGGGSSGLGIGLGNIRERLELIYEVPIELTLEESQGTFRAALHLPLGKEDSLPEKSGAV